MNDIGEKKQIKCSILSCIGEAIIACMGVGIIDYGEQIHNYNLMLAGLMCIFICNIVVLFFNIKKRLLGIVFYCMMFLFLISRIIIPAIQGEIWWNRVSLEANIFAVKSIGVSLITLALGIFLSEIIFFYVSKHHFSSINSKRKSYATDTAIMLNVVRVVLLIAMVCFLINEIDKVLFMQGKTYEEYYVSYRSRVPYCISAFGGCMQFFLCIFLALKPEKKECFFWLCIYIISTLPMLIIGARNPFILSCLFAFLYYYLRDCASIESEKKWIGKKERLLIVCIIPILIITMGAYNYIRSDKDVDLSLVYLAMDFAYKQGTTYDTVLQGYKYQDELPNRMEKNYTLGAIKDSLAHSTLGEKLFNVEDIGNGNCLKHAYNGNTFSHAISYVVLGEKYIAGEGRGSSYIIENYIDRGVGGIVAFSFLLGWICASIPILFKRNWIISTISLTILLNFFFTPRAESTAFITFIFSYKYWACILGSLFLCAGYKCILKKTNGYGGVIEVKK